jgi:site-specific DNA-cytosine methylase
LGGAVAEGALMPLADMLALQGLPADFCKHIPFKLDAFRQMLGNGVPRHMGRAIAKAVREATA